MEYYNEQSPTQLKEKILERLDIYMNHTYPKSLDKDLSIDIQEYTADQMALTLKATLWADEIKTEDDYVEVPATWWDAFKLKYLHYMHINYRRIARTVKHYHIDNNFVRPEPTLDIQLKGKEQELYQINYGNYFPEEVVEQYFDSKDIAEKVADYLDDQMIGGGMHRVVLAYGVMTVCDDRIYKTFKQWKEKYDKEGTL